MVFDNVFSALLTLFDIQVSVNNIDVY